LFFHEPAGKRVVRVSDVLDDERDGVRAAPGKVSGSCAGTVVQGVNGRPHPRACLFGHGVDVVEHTGDGALRHTGESRNVVDRYLFFPHSHKTVPATRQEKLNSASPKVRQANLLCIEKTHRKTHEYMNAP